MGAKGFYHAIVVMGVEAIAACGQTEENPTTGDMTTVSGGPGRHETSATTATGGGAGVPADATLQPYDCEYQSQYRCDSYEPRVGCRCDETLPRGPEDCGGAARISCERVICSTGEICSSPADLVDCRCVEEAPFSPQDCSGPGQFTCAFYAPEYRDCRCDEERPAVPGACSEPESYFCEVVEPEPVSCFCGESGLSQEECVQEACHYECQSYEPRFGCRCDCITIR